MPVLEQPSVQLYTIRTALAADPAGSLRRLAEIGYRRVEPYQLPEFAGALAPAFAETGLVAPSAHAGLLDGRQEEVFDAAQRLGIGTVIEPMADPARWQTRDGVARLAEELGRVAQQAAARGLRVGYHNHAFELSTRIDGRAALEVFAEYLPPEVVLEVDTYWAAVGGEDPVALLRRLGERVRYLHLKDGPLPPDGDGRVQVALGRGAMPVAELVAAVPWLEAGVVELDDHDGDVWTAVAESWQFLAGR